MGPDDRHIWLNGETFDTAYLFDPSSGAVVQRVQLGRDVGATAGLGQKCGRSFLAVYIDPNGHDLWVQVDSEALVIDEDTHATHESPWWGARSRLRITRPDHVALQVSCFLRVGALVQPLIDVTYDELDRIANDFPADVASIIESSDRHQVLREVKDPQAGPWNTLAGY